MPGFGVGANLANYGSRGRSPSLASAGMDQQAEATKELGAAATAESKRNAQNTLSRAEAKQGNMALGAQLGGMAGAPIATSIASGLAGTAAAGGVAEAAGVMGATAASGAGAGALSGAEAGSAIGPWGTIIGGVVGALAAGLFSQ